MPEIPENNPGAADASFIDETPPAPELGGDQSEAGARSRKKGRSALRIDLRAGNAGAGGAGLNVPRG